MAVDLVGVVHVNAIYGIHGGFWALCERVMGCSTLLVSWTNRPTPTCLWCALAVMSQHA